MLTLVYGRFTGGGLADELNRRAKLDTETQSKVSMERNGKTQVTTLYFNIKTCQWCEINPLL